MTLKGTRGSFGLLNPDEKTADRIISDLVDVGVQYEETSGNITWYPPDSIERVYFEYK